MCRLCLLSRRELNIKLTGERDVTHPSCTCRSGEPTQGWCSLQVIASKIGYKRLVREGFKVENKKNVTNVIRLSIIHSLLFNWRLSLHQTSMTLSVILDSFFVVNKDLKVIAPFTLSERNFHKISQLSTNLRSLVLQNCSWLTDDILKPVLKNNPKLEVLDIADCLNCSSAILQVENTFYLIQKTTDWFFYLRFSLSTAPTSPGSYWEAVPGLTLMASTIFPIIETAERKQMISKYVCCLSTRPL